MRTKHKFYFITVLVITVRLVWFFLGGKKKFFYTNVTAWNKNLFENEFIKKKKADLSVVVSSDTSLLLLLSCTCDSERFGGSQVEYRKNYTSANQSTYIRDTASRDAFQVSSTTASHPTWRKTPRYRAL